MFSQVSAPWFVLFGTRGEFLFESGEEWGGRAGRLSPTGLGLTNPFISPLKKTNGSPAESTDRPINRNNKIKTVFCMMNVVDFQLL
jgi:hypothetical protein